ncbi:metal ABC transporter permease [Pseudanabaena sp. FACHB-2040]|uniref:metal ABC transporter permease n=1 Tax=Pseudanabaena sp. FACHB-2040 TaxID=2692859 RepID=UPI001689C0F8|nr:metal ABC transporter permease [Pseudanabaena sp. FACHB-2040]MBD2258172.1 metal ABC transporter permease [Pseudanabaena sp. FACHB-2040]
MDWLFDPLAYEFIRNAMIAGILAGVLCPVVGTYLIVQRMSLLGNVLSHSVLPGLAIAHFLRWDLLIGAFIFGMLSTGVITWVKAQSRIKADAIMALTLAAFFALGVALLTILRSTLDLESLLFGDLLSVTRADLWHMGLITLGLLATVKLFYKELLFFTFDPSGAEAMGLPVTVINWGLTAAVTLTIVTGMKAVGVILVIALMVGPALTAFLLVKELHWMMIVGAALGAVASIIGIYLSYYLDIPSGPTIALAVFALFLVALMVSPSQGILTRNAASQQK